MSEENVLTYPTPPDVDGFFYESEDDFSQDIFTKIYPNGNKIKKTLLPHCKKEAIIRELIARETKEVARYMNKDPEKYQLACITVSLSLNGEKQPIEDIENLKMKDFTRIMGMYQDLNF